MPNLAETSQQAKNRRGVDQLKHVEACMKNIPLVHVNRAIDLPLLITWRNTKKYAQLQKACEKIDYDPSLASWQHELVVNLKMRQQSISLTALRTEILHHVAVDELEHQLAGLQPQGLENLDPESWGGKTVTDLFGKPCSTDNLDPDSLEDGRNPILALLFAWCDLLHGGNTPEEATQVVFTDDFLFKSIVGEKPENEAADWHQQAKEAVGLALQTWTKQYQTLIADNVSVLVSAADMTEGSVGFMLNAEKASELLIPALDWATHQQRGVLRCHPTIAAYVMRKHGRLVAPFRLQEKIVPRTETTTETIKMALILWDPAETEGAYQTFGAALAAVEAL